MFDLSASKRAKRDLKEKVASTKKKKKDTGWLWLKLRSENLTFLHHFYIIGHEMPSNTEKGGS